MEQSNKNEGAGTQINNQSANQNIGTQIGTQNNYYKPTSDTLSIDGIRNINQNFKSLIDAIKRNAAEPTKEVIDFRDEYKQRFPRTVYSIPIKYLRFRKNNGRIISDVESFEKEHDRTLNEEDDDTQELLRSFYFQMIKKK